MKQLTHSINNNGDMKDKMITREPTTKDWNRFVNEGLQEWNESNKSNVVYSFKKMCEQFGLSYLYWLELQYRLCIEYRHLTLDELVKWNGNPPTKFLERFK